MAFNPPIGSIYHKYTTDILGLYLLATTFYGNQKQPLIQDDFLHREGRSSASIIRGGGSPC